MPYHVGQVLFVVLNKKMLVYPMLVIEEIVKRTLQGEETNYVLQGGTDKDATVLLNQVDGEIFESAEEAKYVLTSRATTQIEKIVDSAVLKASEWYAISNKSVSLPQESFAVEKNDETEPFKVELPDGTIANLKNFGMVG